ncbi:MMPL family transporter [Yinghuangia seranimata]|uniref:MMPL family transporter n=1 Tax=Yinghuangia seranimata TaxID=408067 RepID=UPI00248C2E41|nr:MMPL family transporter [Yinghuangia seranimata]MDI2132631.1 MMPL family transporter [Yinghuangia seranimata]
MLERIGTLAAHRARTVLVTALVLLVAAAGLGFGAFGVLKSEGFDDPGSDSYKAKHTVSETFGGTPNLVVEVRTGGRPVDDPAIADAGRRLTQALAAQPDYKDVASYWTTGSPALKSKDGTKALLVARSPDDVEKLPAPVREAMAADLAPKGPITLELGGDAPLSPTVTGQVGKSLAIAEAIAVPLTMLLLVLAFGSVVAALVPLAIGFVAIMGTFAELFVLGNITDVSVFSINLTTALGLGLAIDYALLIVARHRELVHGGMSVPDAVVRTVQTAGRTIVFSAATVAAALAVMLVFPMYFLRSFAYAGIGVVIISALAALFVAPALLSVLGPRVEAGRIRGIKGVQGAETPFWARLAGTVAKRPVLTALPVLAALLLAASPLLGVKFGTPDERVLPSSASLYKVGESLRNDYSSNEAHAIDVIVEGKGAGGDLSGYAVRISGLEGVARVDTSTGSYAHGTAVPAPGNPRLAARDAQLFSVSSTLVPKSDAAQSLVKDIRALDGPQNTHVMVGGVDAQLIDTKKAIADRVPLALGLIALTTFVVLFLFTGSVVQPLRALLLNGLSIAAAMGVAVWVFQSGHLSGPLGFTPLPMDTSMTVLLFCIAFGLSMDYEVFVMSRIKELHDAGASDTDAVTYGLARTGRIVSTAAMLLAVTFIAFVTSSVSFLQLFGLGAAVAILIDASLIRGVLVPASMRLLGPTAWYAPRGLRRLHAKVGVSESPSDTDERILV